MSLFFDNTENSTKKTETKNILLFQTKKTQKYSTI